MVEFQKQNVVTMIVKDGIWVAPISPHFGLTLGGARLTPADLRAIADKLEEIYPYEGAAPREVLTTV